MKIGIIGIRGIPNFYGGFEQFAENFSLGLVEMGHTVTVYNSSLHPFKENQWKGVYIVHCKDLEDKIGTAGQFIYDLNCILHARKSQYDIILQLGYTSSSIWGWLLPNTKSIIVTNMDGLEWKRSKYTLRVQRFLKHAEKLAVKYSKYLIADSVGIQSYLKNEYKRDSVYIPYGAHVFNDPNRDVLEKYDLTPYHYSVQLARLEPENNFEMIANGFIASGKKEPLLIIGKHETKYGAYLKAKYAGYPLIRFLGAIYDINILNNLRYHSSHYFHGHTVGGTNPSLLEAMASQSMVCAHDNIFNKSILGEDAFYFSDAGQIASLLTNENKTLNSGMVLSNMDKIKNIYSWSNINNQYISYFEHIAAI